MNTMKMSGLYSHLILMVNPYVLLQRLIYYLLENANNANAVKTGKRSQVTVSKRLHMKIESRNMWKLKKSGQAGSR
jgi:hypothetical protein